MNVFLASIALAVTASASAAALADGAQPLTHDELQQLLPGADVRITFSDGATDVWTNSADGSLSAVWTSGSGSSKHYTSHGSGTWKISDDGKFCAHIVWPKQEVNWCRPVIRTGDGTFVLSGSPEWQLQVSK